MANDSQRGIKRKRNNASEEDLAVRLQGKLHHNLREVRQAVKKAKTFDIQKLVKRLKDAKKKPGDNIHIADLEAQLNDVKTVDLDNIAAAALRSKINKDHTLSSNEHVQAAVSATIPTPSLPTSGSGSSKAQSRLLSSKLVAAEIVATLEALRAIISPATVATTHDESDAEFDSDGDHKRLVTKTSQPSASKDNSVELGPVVEEDASSDKEGVGDDGWESGTIDGDDDDDEEESKAGDNTENSEGEEIVEDSDVVIGSGQGNFDDSDDEDNLSDRPLQKTTVSSSKTTANPRNASESTFLPSLAVGFTRGDSDSDWSDSEAKAADGVRKNRRGQRARRAIWEKKYGKGANHVKKQRELADSRRGGRGGGMRRGPRTATSGENRRFDARAPPARSGEWVPPRVADKGWKGGATATIPPPPPPRRRFEPPKQDSKPIHPSWEAKRRQKEKESASIVPAAGKKIKFD